MIKVYFESNSHADLVATFSSEDLYIASLPALEKKAKEQGMIVTEYDDEQDWETEYDDEVCVMSHRDQCNADRSDYINERLENGEIDDMQAAELRMGA